MELLPKRTPYDGLCIAPSCDSPAKFRGVCMPCYHRLRRRGTTEKVVYDESARKRIFWASCSSNQETGCHEWTGHKSAEGYGLFCFRNVQHYAHRLAWLFAYGSLPDNMCVCHTCDNPKCINPKHLFLGTKLDNNRDMVAKNRYVGGFVLQKLTPEQVKAIFFSKDSGRKLAKEYNVSASQIYAIKNGQSYRRITCSLASTTSAEVTTAT